MYLNRHTPGPGVEKLNQIWQEPMSNRSTTNLWKVIAALYEISMMNWLLFVILKWIMCNYYCYQFVMYDTNSRHSATQYQTHGKLKLRMDNACDKMKIVHSISFASSYREKQGKFNIKESRRTSAALFKVLECLCILFRILLATSQIHAIEEKNSNDSIGMEWQ